MEPSVDGLEAAIYRPTRVSMSTATELDSRKVSIQFIDALREHNCDSRRLSDSVTGFKTDLFRRRLFFSFDGVAHHHPSHKE
jgi:hypothetical protein